MISRLQKATVAWATDERAVSGVSLNQGAQYLVFRDENLTTRHEIRVTGLSPSTAYDFTVSSIDALGNGPTLSDTHSFKTLALPDSDPPFVVSPLKIAGITQKSAVVHWRTDEPTDGVILYGTSPSNLHWSKADARLKRKHNVQLTRLAKNTRYYLKAVSRDSAGNTIETPVESFITRNLPGCGKPRFVKRPTVVGKSDTIVTIEWEMDQPTDAVVEFGEDNHLYRQSAHGEKKTRHSVTLGGLEPGRSHNYRVRCTGTCGNTS